MILYCENLGNKPINNFFVPIEYLESKLNSRISSIEWLTGDGSDRSYFRIFAADRTFVLMKLSETDKPKLHDGNYDWIKIQQTLKKNNIPVPEFYQACPEYSCLIIEDYGDITLEQYIRNCIENNNFQQIYKLYEDCLDLIIKMLSIPKDFNEIWTQRSFDYDKYLWELNFFIKQFFTPVVKRNFSNTEQELFDKESKDLALYLCDFSKYFNHRDYHSRNIMIKNNKIALLDFQDARLGSSSYDLVSLIFDNYVPLDISFRLNLIDKSIQKIAKYDGNIAQEILNIWPAFVLQRQLKAIGSYGYLTLNQKKGNYLKYVPLAIDSLKAQPIYNQHRWPFLSCDLINMMDKHIDYSFHELVYI